MIFHTSNLHLLDSVGQGNIMCERVTMPHQLCWDGQEVGTALLYRNGSHVAGLTNMVDKSISKLVSLHIAVLLVPKTAVIVIYLC